MPDSDARGIRISKYQCLDICWKVADAVATVNELSCDRSCDLKPWWRGQVSSTLLDELPEDNTSHEWSHDQCYKDVNIVLQTSILKSMTQEQVCTQNLTGAGMNPLAEKDINVLHDVHMHCCDAFDVRNGFSRVSMATDCLPFLQIICKSEKERKNLGTKRK